MASAHSRGGRDGDELHRLGGEGRRCAAYDRVVAQAPATRDEGGGRRPQRSHGASLITPQHGAVFSPIDQRKLSTQMPQMQPGIASTTTSQNSPCVLSSLAGVAFTADWQPKTLCTARPAAGDRERRNARAWEPGLSASGRNARDRGSPWCFIASTTVRQDLASADIRRSEGLRLCVAGPVWERVWEPTRMDSLLILVRI